jgi:multicomponent Na+:H+ antiporter subunit A
MFKGGLFMVAGTVDHEAGTRDITKLGGLAKAMPITFGAALPCRAFRWAACRRSSVSSPRRKSITAWAQGDTWSLVFTLVAIVGNALMFVIGFAVALKPFLGPKVETPKHAHEGPVLLWPGRLFWPSVGPVLGAVFRLASTNWSRTPMASAVTGHAADITISVVPHLGLALYLSLATIAASASRSISCWRPAARGDGRQS